MNIIKLLAIPISICLTPNVYSYGSEIANNYIVANQQQTIKLPISTCIQYQAIKKIKGKTFTPFHKYGFKIISRPDTVTNVWGYNIIINQNNNSKNLNYKNITRKDLYSFAIIDNTSKNGKSQYIFWWKGYYRQFASQLREIGFTMKNVAGKTNVLRFERSETNIIVDFTIWEDIYIMEISTK